MEAGFSQIQSHTFNNLNIVKVVIVSRFHSVHPNHSHYSLLLLNQTGAGHRPARAWFLKIDPVRIVGMRVRVCMCVCPRPRLLITSGVIWRDVNLIQLVKQVLQLLYGNYSCYC